MRRTVMAVLLGTMTWAGCGWGATAAAPDKLHLAGVLTSHMVLQHGMAVPIWGTAAAHADVTVSFAGQTKQARADAKGAWLVKLEPLEVSSESRTLTVATGAGAEASTVKLDDVLVGDVWVGSGQSNMQTPVTSYTGNDPVLATNAAMTYPRLRLLRNVNGAWEVASPASVRPFSALLFSFGVPLQKALDMPVGLMVGAVGGTPSGPWLSPAAYSNDAACQAMVAKAAAAYTPEKAEQARQAYEKAVAAWAQSTNAAVAAGKPAPRRPEAPVAPGVCKGAIGNLYERWVRPMQPFAIRGVLWDQGESGTAIQNVDQFTLMGALIRGWRQEWGQGDFPFLYVQKPSGGGCAWDRDDPVTAKAEPFVPAPAVVPADGGYRETHIRIMEIPNTAMVTASDLGSGIHPVCKSGYGARACRVALGKVYGKPVEFLGPLYQSQAVEGKAVRIRFAHVGKGLALRPGCTALQGFAVAGADKKFVWATAVIDGDSIVVSNDQVAAPVAVRYAWSQNHAWANLFNTDGLPALPFRTDSW